MRCETSHILAGAARSNGGDYPDPEVRERVDILKLVLTIVFLIPSAFSVCILTLSDMVYKVIMLPYHNCFRFLPNVTVRNQATFFVRKYDT